MMKVATIRLFLQFFLLGSTFSTVVKVGYSIEEPGSEDDSPLDKENFVEYSKECDDKCCWISFKDRCNFTGYHIVANEWTTYVISDDDKVIECNKRYHKYHKGSCKGGRFEGKTIAYNAYQDENGVIVFDTTKDCNYFATCDGCLTSNGTFLFQESEVCHVFNGFYQVKRDFYTNVCGPDLLEPSTAPSATMSPTGLPTEISTITTNDEPTTNPTPSFTSLPVTTSPTVPPTPSPTVPPTLPPTTPPTLPPTTPPTLPPTPSPTLPPTPSPTLPPTPSPTLPPRTTLSPSCSISNDAEPCSAQLP